MMQSVSSSTTNRSATVSQTSAVSANAATKSTKSTTASATTSTSSVSISAEGQAKLKAEQGGESTARPAKRQFASIDDAIAYGTMRANQQAAAKSPAINPNAAPVTAEAKSTAATTAGASSTATSSTETAKKADASTAAASSTDTATTTKKKSGVADPMANKSIRERTVNFNSAEDAMALSRKIRQDLEVRNQEKAAATEQKAKQAASAYTKVAANSIG